MADLGLEAWLERAANRGQWQRLAGALELDEGFALHLALVSDASAEDMVTGLLRARARELGRQLVTLEARAARDQAPARRLAQLPTEEPVVVALRTVSASRADIEALERSFVQLNARRDQLVASVPGPLVVILRVDALRHMLDVAPDFYSVHRAQFRFSAGRTRERAPGWLLKLHELAGLLGLSTGFGPAAVDDLPSPLRELPEVPARLLGRDRLLAELDTRLRPGAGAQLFVVGDAGVGKTALVAAGVRQVEAHWERVLWVDGRSSTSTDLMLRAIVSALTEDEAPAILTVDLIAQYQRLTAHTDVLVIIDDGDEHGSFPLPGGRSSVVTTTASLGDPSLPSLAVPDLSEDLCVTLWGEVAHVTPPTFLLDHIQGQHMLLTIGYPAVDRLVATLLARGQLDNIDLTSLFEAALDSTNGLLDWLFEELLQPHEATLLGVLLRMPAAHLPIPRALLVTMLGRESLAAAETLASRGLLTTDRATWKLSEPGLALAPSLPAQSAPALTKHLLGRDAYSALERWLLRYLPLGPELPTELLSAAIASRELPHRPRDLAGLARALSGTERRHALCLRAVAKLEAHLELGDLDSVTQMRALVDDSPDPEVARLLLALALRDLDRHEHGSAIAEAMRAHAVFALELLSSELEQDVLERLRDAVDSGSPVAQLDELDLSASSTVPIEHFIHVRALWQAIADDELDELDELASEVRRTARAWGSPYALLRARLLELEVARSKGDQEQAARIFIELQHRFEELHSPTHAQNLELLAAGAELLSQTSQAEATAEVQRAIKLWAAYVTTAAVY